MGYRAVSDWLESKSALKGGAAFKRNITKAGNPNSTHVSDPPSSPKLLQTGFNLNPARDHLSISQISSINPPNPSPVGLSSSSTNQK